MRGVIRTFAALAAVLVAASALQAQTSNRQAVYSRFGVGQLQDFASSQTQALGGAAVGLLSVNYLNLSNPAAWSDQVYTRLSVGFRYLALESTDALNQSAKMNSGMLSAIQAGVPIYSRRLGLVFAIQPYSRVGYYTEREGNLEASGTEPASSYLSIAEGGGGLQSIMAGAGLRLNRYISAGAGLDVVFGIIDYERKVQMNNATQFVASTGSVRSTRMSGVSATAGLTFIVPNLSAEGSRLTVGTSVSLPNRLRATQVLTLSQAPVADTVGTVTRGNVTLPLRARLGVAYRASGKYLWVAEGRYEPWNRFKGSIALGGYEPGGETVLRDSWRVGAGLEWSPSSGLFHPNFFRRSLYRLGGYLEQAYYNPDTGTNIQTMAATAGLSIPSLFPGTYVDLNVELGKRGSAQGSLVRDLYVAVAATINFGERWFVKRRFR